jgi:hypothetical protein
MGPTSYDNSRNAKAASRVRGLSAVQGGHRSSHMGKCNTAAASHVIGGEMRRLNVTEPLTAPKEKQP